MPKYYLAAERDDTKDKWSYTLGSHNKETVAEYVDTMLDQGQATYETIEMLEAVTGLVSDVDAAIDSLNRKQKVRDAATLAKQKAEPKAVRRPDTWHDRTYRLCYYAGIMSKVQIVQELINEYGWSLKEASRYTRTL